MAMQGRELFNGSIPPELLAQIVNAVDFGKWSSIWVGCSGTFSFERGIRKRYAKAKLYGNDVGLISGIIASVAQEQPLDFRFTNELADWESMLDGRPYLDRAAAMILAMVLAGQYRGKSVHSRKHWNYYLSDLDAALSRPKERLQAMAAELDLEAYMPGDFREHLVRCGEAGGGFIVSAPFVKGFYEGWFKFINANVEWDAPKYDMWDPDHFPDLLDQIDGMGIPYIAVYKQPLEGKHVACYFRKGMHPPFYVLTSDPPKATSLVDRPPVTQPKPFKFKPVDINKLSDKTRVRIYPCKAGNADYVKGLFLQENITFTSGMVNMLIYLDDMLAGVLTFNRMNRGVGGWKVQDAVYLLSDTSTTRYGRVAKLIAMLATCEDVLGYCQRRLTHRPVKQVITTVRTNAPVSMKYRGIYNIISRKEPDERDTSGSQYILNYGSDPRPMSPDEIYAEWWRKHFKDDQSRQVTNSYAKNARSTEG